MEVVYPESCPFGGSVFGRVSQHVGRQAQSGQAGSDRMVSESGNNSRGFPSIRRPRYRSVRNPKQPEVSCVLQQGSPSNGLLRGCHADDVVGDLGLCISPDSIDSQGARQDPERPGMSCSGGPVLASQTLVSQIDDIVGRSSTQAARQARSSVTVSHVGEKNGVSHDRRQMASSGVHDFGAKFTQQGVS